MADDRSNFMLIRGLDTKIQFALAKVDVETVDIDRLIRSVGYILQEGLNGSSESDRAFICAWLLTLRWMNEFKGVNALIEKALASREML